MQTGDFLYMVKGYEPGNRLKADLKKLEEKFNEVLEDYAISLNTKSEDVGALSTYVLMTNEINKLLIIVKYIDLKIRKKTLCVELEIEIDNSDVAEMLEGFKVERSDDLETQRDKILKKIEKYQNDLNKAKSTLEKPSEKNEEVDIDEQYMNVCQGLEMQYDERSISLYQYGIMIKMLMKRIESLNKTKR